MRVRAYLGTRSGVYRLQGGQLECLGLRDHRFWAIHAWRDATGQDFILAGSYGSGIFRSMDSGASWVPANDGLSAAAIRTIQPDPGRSGALLAGTEPARAFRSLDGGARWFELEAITEIEGCDGWFLPYSPRAGAIRNFARSARGDLYASVEVGGLLRSDDSGDSWRLIGVDPGPRVHDDIHFVITDPIDDDRLFVAMGGALVDRTHGQWSTSPRQIGGVAVSEDAGRSWTKLVREYTRAVLIPDADQDWLIAAPAERTDHGGWVVGSEDRGATWQRIDDGIETPMDDMVERFEEAPDGRIWAISSGGRLFVAEPAHWQWSSPLPRDASELIVESVTFVDM